METEFWSKVWLGRLGRGLFALGGKLLGRRGPGAAMTHRATELSLGMAAEQLYEALPKSTRAALKELPATLHRLQADAQTLRQAPCRVCGRPSPFTQRMTAVNTLHMVGGLDDYEPRCREHFTPLAGPPEAR